MTEAEYQAALDEIVTEIESILDDAVLTACPTITSHERFQNWAGFRTDLRFEFGPFRVTAIDTIGHAIIEDYRYGSIEVRTLFGKWETLPLPTVSMFMGKEVKDYVRVFQADEKEAEKMKERAATLKVGREAAATLKKLVARLK